MSIPKTTPNKPVKQLKNHQKSFHSFFRWLFNEENLIYSKLIFHLNRIWTRVSFARVKNTLLQTTLSGANAPSSSTVLYFFAHICQTVNKKPRHQNVTRLD